VPDSNQGSLDAGAHAQFGIEIGQVTFDGTGAEGKLIGDVSVAQPFAQQYQ